ncbi:MAG: ABC transporter permease [Candidatus Methanosuratus sp.]|uniref:ABC transporter permease subunit n=1 Tax=Candidatus Methanosuratincola petrocarbonis (ex Vanwonterghem et al. 2016) TaxID=1867261 RepID=A0A7J3V165_9CREN|nr:ABC transporter permease [Candidatus Methanosuratincola sp.]
MEIFLDGISKAFGLILSSDPEVLGITALSLKVSVVATMVGAAFGVPLGFLIASRSFCGRSLLVAVINTFMGVPPVVVGLVVYLILSSSGPLGFLRILYTPQAMILAQTLLTFPVVCGLTISSILGLDPNLKETLQSLSAPKLWEAAILLRESRIGLIAAVIAAFGAAISEVGAIMMVGGNILGYTRALTTAIMLYTNTGEFALAIALGIILLTVSFGINLLLTVLQIKYRKRR